MNKRGQVSEIPAGAQVQVPQKSNLWIIVSILAVIVLIAVFSYLILKDKTPSDIPANITNNSKPPLPPNPGGQPASQLCGDGVCDDKEKSNPSLCPKDCTALSVNSSGSSNKTIGFVGCSLTLGAVKGYQTLGGDKMWTDSEASTYPGGSAYTWYSGISDVNDKRWPTLISLIAKYPETSKIWWMLCPGTEETNTYEQETAVLEKIQSIAPGREIYITAAPTRTGYTCSLETSGSQSAVLSIASQLVSEGKVKQGPSLTSLEQAQTGDNCHPNSEGQAVWGNNLKSFFG